MDDEQVGYWVIVGLLLFSFWKMRRVFLAMYLEDGVKMFNFLFIPFAVYFKFRKAMKEAKDERVEEIIEKHKSK